MNENLQFTPLRDEHVRLGAKMVDFAGWYMPVEYTGLRAEHLSVRSDVGLFDVSHMGEIRVSGPEALATLEWLTTNHVGKLEDGQAQYSLLPNFEGGLVDDLIVYCLKKNQEYLLCVNASNADKDYAWIVANNKGAELRNESKAWGQIAVQGPKAMGLIAKIFGAAASAIPTFGFREFDFSGVKVLVARTGYTGEDGVEVFVPAPQTVTLWQTLLSEGKNFGVVPVGLGARDTLRTEMKYSLYGHEIDAHTNPYAAGLGWVVKPDAKDFIGRSVILSQKEKGLPQKLIGFKMCERGIARQGYKLVKEGRVIGTVTSGTPSPSTGENIGIAFVDKEFAADGTEFGVEIRGRSVGAIVVSTPFVKRK